MPRRSQPRNIPEELRQSLVELLTNFAEELKKDDLRQKVVTLVPAFHTLRDLGSSLIPKSEASSARDRIIAYLKQYPGIIIDGDELMVVSGISEWARRVRELRVQFGWWIYSGVTFKQMAQNPDDAETFKAMGIDPSLIKPDQYVLMSTTQDLEAAYRWNVLNEIRKKKIGVKEKIIEYLRKNVGKQVTGEELSYLAGNTKEWARRVRELRTEEGWPIATKNTGRDDLPVGVYVLEEDNIHEDSKYWYLTKLAAECTAKRMVPDYISEKVMKELKKNELGDGECYPCMGCRSFLTPDRTMSLGNIAKAKNYVEGKGKYYGRFNQGVVTINLPDVALSADGDMDEFWEIFDERLELCHKALQIRHKRLSTVTSDVAPILWQNGALARLEKGESIHELLHHGYSTISLGYAGLYECVKVMTGHSHTDNGEGKEFGLKVMQHLNDMTNKWKKEEDIDYSVYGTPIESTTYKFAKCLKERFGTVKGITDRGYITNSYHVPVFEEIDAFSKLKLESEFQKLSPGGAISYVETPNLQNNLDAIIEVIKFIYDNIMYAELNTKSDYCQKCGYTGEILIDDNLEWYCPNCGNRDHNTLNVARRTCGYIGTNFWNKGRTQEIKERVLHIDNKEA